MSETIATWMRGALNRLGPEPGERRLELQALVAARLGKTRSWVLAHGDHALPGTIRTSLERDLAGLLSGQPLSYLTGKSEFYGLEFQVSQDVLIPRPETELLVDQALTWLHESGAGNALDIGTGSGCIAVTLARHCPGLHLTAMDMSAAALRVAHANAVLHGVQHYIGFLRCDLGSAVSGRFGLVCANLPYIPSDLLAGLPVARWEPGQALDGGPDGLTFIRRLLDDLARLLGRPGCALLEIEASQGGAVRTIAQGLFPEASVAILQDLGLRDRLLRIILGGKNA